MTAENRDTLCNHGFLTTCMPEMQVPGAAPAGNGPGNAALLAVGDAGDSDVLSPGWGTLC